MTNLGEEGKVEETEYESGSEESVFALALRRRNASDDDGAYTDIEGEARARLVRSDRKVWVGYGDESDGLGGYDDYEEVSYVDEYEELGDEKVEMFEEEKEENHIEKREYQGRSCEEGDLEEVTLKQRQEKKERKPPVNPENGAFYMHDDRFVGRGLRRWRFGERFRGFEDEEKWKHDKFEETNVQETYEVRTTYERYYQGHRKNQGKGRGYVKANSSKTYDNMNNQNYSSRIVKGRGPIKYKPITRSSSVHSPTKNKQSKKPQSETSNIESTTMFPRKKKSGRFVGVASNTDSVRVSSQSSNVESDSLASETHVLAANTSSALHMLNSSPSHCATQKKDEQHLQTSGYFPTSALPNHKIFALGSNSLLHAKIVANPIGQDKFYAEKLIHPASESYLTNLPLQPSISWPTYTIASPQMMGQKDLSFSTMLTLQLSPISDQVSGVYPLAQHPVVQQMPVESTLQPPLKVLPQELGPCSGKGFQASSEALLPNSYDPGTPGPVPRPSNSKVLLGGKGISVLQGSGRGSSISVETHGDQNFPVAGALFPAMRPGSLHNDDLGDPAVNMLVSGYISPSQSVFGNPEITWLPVFPAAARPLGAAYSSLYVTDDDGYYTHSTGQSSSLGVTRNQNQLPCMNGENKVCKGCKLSHLATSHLPPVNGKSYVTGPVT